MVCFYHQNREATVQCNHCGKNLCTECGSRFQPPTCPSCVEDYVKSIEKEMVKNIAVSVVLMLIGIFVIRNPLGILLAGIPYGWSLLTRITPAMFIWMPLIGWVIYFFIKLFLSYAIGIVALPITAIFKNIGYSQKLKYDAA